MTKKLMALFSIPASTANLIYNISFVSLVVGAALVLISATALVWSSSIRERDASERLALVETADARAAATTAKKAEADLTEATRLLAQANANAAAAEKEAAAAKLQTQKEQAPTSGRVISMDNRELFIDFVKTVGKGRVVTEAISSDPEAVSFTHQVSDMLTGAGYTVVENIGSHVLLGNPPVGVEMRIRSMEEQPPYAGSLQKGLEFIGIPTSGSLDSTAGDSVIIFIGTKP